MEEQKTNLKTFLPLIIFGDLVVIGMIVWFVLQNQKNDFEKVAQFNCEQSGGDFNANEDICSCGSFNYKEETGYCADTLGLPGGELGETAKKLQELDLGNSKDDASKNQDSLSQADKDGNYYGELTVTGYPIIKEVDEFFCEENCKKYSYVFFKILKNNNAALFDFLKASGDNFVGDEQIGLGCVENGIINYFNDSNRFGMREYAVSAGLSKRILEATKENPVSIELERLFYTGGRGAPVCYSHFTYIR
jgi:hypothetical protein